MATAMVAETILQMALKPEIMGITGIMAVEFWPVNCAV
jgi:hypothetical protein